MTQHAFFEGYEQSHTERRLVDEQERPIMYKAGAMRNKCTSSADVSSS
jgi:hypothetical protein